MNSYAYFIWCYSLQYDFVHAHLQSGSQHVAHSSSGSTVLLYYIGLLIQYEITKFRLLESLQLPKWIGSGDSIYISKGKCCILPSHGHGCHSLQFISAKVD